MSSYFTKALEELRPNSEWAVTGDDYSRFIWLDKIQKKPSQQQIEEKIVQLKAAEPYRLLREERNKLIAETDWTQLKDIDLDIIRERNWKNYRQALRDLPAKSNPKLDSYGNLDMSSITWPTKPSS